MAIWKLTTCPIATIVTAMWHEQETYIFTRQEVHGPLNVPDSNTAADMRHCWLDPHFSKQVHHTWATVHTRWQFIQDLNYGIYMIVSVMYSCLTWLAVWFFKGIQPVEAENLLPICPLHQWELTGVNLYLSWSLTGSTFLILSPRASNHAGP